MDHMPGSSRWPQLGDPLLLQQLLQQADDGAHGGLGWLHLRGLHMPASRCSRRLQIGLLCLLLLLQTYVEGHCGLWREPA